MLPPLSHLILVDNQFPLFSFCLYCLLMFLFCNEKHSAHTMQKHNLISSSFSHHRKCYCSSVAQFSSVQFSLSVMSNSLRPMSCSNPGLPVHHRLQESTQTCVHWVSNAIQPSHPLSSSSPALNLSQNQDLSKGVSSLHQVATVLRFQLQHQSFQWRFRTDLLRMD